MKLVRNKNNCELQMPIMLKMENFFKKTSSATAIKLKLMF